MNIRLIKSNDWEGLYVDDKLVIQRPNLTAEDVLIGLKINYNSNWLNQDWADENVIPYDVNEIPEEAYDD